jgi:exo-beta-1,3-glucanase (GH17 family)
MILEPHWDMIRIYDCSEHANLVLRAITNESLNLKVMLGVDLRAEINNPGCPWGGIYTDDELESNRNHNDAEINQLIDLSNVFLDQVFAVSIGNEASVDWTDHLVPVERLVELATRVKTASLAPVTFCENYVPWTQKLQSLVEIIDIISVHTYPVWEYQSLENAISYTEQNYLSVANAYPDKQVIITEAGWTTQSNGRGIEPHNVSVEHQRAYLKDLILWSQNTGVLTFVFEAFDEPWKGSNDPLEPEKHWGLYYVDRTPKHQMIR